MKITLKELQKAGDVVLDRLFKMIKTDGVELPTTKEDDILMIAGQSVATLLLEEIGFSNYRDKQEAVINDIDCFIISGDKEMSNDGGLSVKESINFDIDSYRARWENISEYKYTIKETYNDGILNNTLIVNNTSITDDLSNEAKASITLKDFDLNITQCGILVENGKLLITKSFLRFLKTGNLEVVNYSTPEHTVVRFAKKFWEFGLHANLIPEFTKLGFALEAHNRRNRRLKFGEKYRKLFLKYFKFEKRWQLLLSDEEKRIPNQFFLKDCSFINENDQELELSLLLNSEYNNGMQISTIDDLLWMLPDFIQAQKNNFYLMKRLTDSYFYNSRKKFDKNIEILKVIVENEFKKFDSNLAAPLIMKFINENKLFDKNLLNRILLNVTNHPRLTHIYFNQNSLEEAYELDKIVRKLSKKHGEVVFGFFEKIVTIKDSIQGYNYLENLLLDYIKEMKKDLKSTSILNKEGVTIGSYNYRELITGYDLLEEGEKMKHCVAGYSRLVSTGNSFIIKVTHINGNKDLNRTVELLQYIIDDEKGGFFISQDMHYKNKKSSNSERLQLIKDLESVGIIFDNIYKDNLISSENKDREEVIYEINIDDDAIPF